MKKSDVSKFIEEAVRWRVFHHTVLFHIRILAHANDSVLVLHVPNRLGSLRPRKLMLPFQGSSL